MTRGMRLLLMFLVLIGVVILMMDCAKKSLQKQKAPKAVAPTSQGSLQPTHQQANLRLVFKV
jgi:hypothetical protein